MVNAVVNPGFTDEYGRQLHKDQIVDARDDFSSDEKKNGIEVPVKSVSDLELDAHDEDPTLADIPLIVREMVDFDDDPSMHTITFR